MTTPANINEITSALSCISADDRDTWWRMAMAVKSELGEAGFDAWDAWSQTASNYNAKAARAVWKGIKAAGGVTIATLFHDARANGWTPTTPYTPPTPEERARIDAERQAADIEAERIKAEMQSQAKAKAELLWQKAGLVRADHPYVITKGIKPFGVKQLGEALLIPLRCNGELVNLQFIYPDGKKRFLTGGQKSGASMIAGTLKGADKALMCEGWATGCSLHEATGAPVVVAFDAGNLITVARKVAQVFHGQVVACGDNDTGTNGNPGKTAAMKAANCFVGGRFILPTFTPEQEARHTQQHGKGPTDWNDVHQLSGIEAVREPVMAAMVETASQPLDENNQAETTDSEASQHDTPANIPPAEEDQYIKYLAELSPIGYERVRLAAAKQMGIKRASVLDKLVNAARKEASARSDENAAGTSVLFDDVEPWPTPVDGAALLEDAYQLLARYVIADRETLRAAALWAAMTWFTNYASVLPLAVITAPEKGCGKSTLLTALAKLACRPLQASNITPAALFRAVEKWRPTLMIDEADAFAKDNEELRGVLNAGHTRDTAVVIRVVEVGGEMEPRAFSVWGAKALAGIGHLPGTIMSRAVVLTMRRKLPDESAESLRHCDRAAFYDVKRRLARWADDVGAEFADMRPTMDGLHNRDADNWEPLLALADIAGGHWPQLARQAAVRLTGGEEDAPSLNEELLADIRSVFERLKVDRIWSEDLLEELCKDDESAWATYNRGKPVGARQLSKRLGEFGIKSDDVRRGSTVRKGYKLEWFADAFARYLPSGGTVSATALQPAPAVAYSHFPIRDTKQDVADRKTLEPAQLLRCSAVADKTPPTGNENEKRDKSNFVEVEI